MRYRRRVEIERRDLLVAEPEERITTGNSSKSGFTRESDHRQSSSLFAVTKEAGSLVRGGQEPTAMFRKRKPAARANTSIMPM